MSKPAPASSGLQTVRNKGRPRAFDRSQALEDALGIFWRRGYEPASVSELCAAMQINPPSLYAAFGSKMQLFMEAVRYYEATYWDSIWQKMAENSDVHVAIPNFFHDAACILTSQATPCGCLVISAAINISAESAQIDEALKKLRRQSYDRLLARVQRGIKDRQLSTSADAQALAIALYAMLEGMSLAARDGVPYDRLDRIAAVVMAVLSA